MRWGCVDVGTMIITRSSVWRTHVDFVLSIDRESRTNPSGYLTLRCLTLLIGLDATNGEPRIVDFLVNPNVHADESIVILTAADLRCRQISPEIPGDEVPRTVDGRHHLR